MSATPHTFAELAAYDWNADVDFQNGLQSILNAAPDHIPREDLVLQAKCFFWSKKTSVSVSADDFKRYLSEVSGGQFIEEPSETQREVENVHTSHADHLKLSEPAGTEGTQAVEGSDSNSGQAPYPTSFADIVELIQSGKPIPGIRDIPNKLSEEKPTEPVKEKRLKPWEIKKTTPE